MPVKLPAFLQGYNLVALDFESYYDSKSYSLRRQDMSTSLYVRDERFKAHTVAFRQGRQRHARWYKGDGIRRELDRIDWSNSILLCHHTHFDGLILSHHYGHVPAFYADTLSMARALHGNHIDSALDTVARYYGRGSKTPDVLAKLDGIRDPDKELLAELGYYNANDVDIMWGIFTDMLDNGYPDDELRLIDMTVSLFTEPVIHVDRDLAEAERRKWKERKEALLTEVIQYDDDALEAVNTIMETAKERIEAGKRPRVSYNEHLGYEELISKTVKSNERYAEMLRKMGIAPPTKPSPSDPTQRIYAFAKNDLDFQALQAHPNEQVRKLVDARLVAQSNINETRAEGLLARSHDDMRLPVYLNYCGAHTMRWCMPGDTEVLTPEGWVRMDVWNGEKIAEWSPNKRMKWHRPTMNRFPYKGDLVVADSMHVKGAFTPEHTIPRWTTKGAFTSNTAAELQNTNVRIPTPGVLGGGVGGSTVLTQLLVAVAADATIENSANRPLVFKFRKQRKIDRLKALLTEAEIPFKQYQCVRETQINISRRDVPPILWEAKNLEVSDVLSWTEHRRQIFIAELHHWDGHFGSDAIHFTTTQPRWVELVTAVAASIGMTSNVYTVEREHLQNTKYEVTLRAPSYVGVPSAGWRQEPYDGDVYCPTTNTGYFVVRSRGKVFVTGNSGGDKLNPQNFPDPAKGTDSRLRECLVAPRGMRLVVVDSAQIEARVIAWLCGQYDKLEAFADPDRDVYCEFASDLYNYSVTKKDAPTERFVGKVCELGLGFGMGPPKLQYTLATGAMGPPLLLDLDVCEKAVDLFRHKNNCIQLGWRQLQQLISSCLIRGHEMTWADLIPMERERALMPNGLDLMYPNIRVVPKDDGSDRVEYRYKQRRNEWSKIYGGLLSENFTQCIARIIIGLQALPVIEHYRMVSLSHDELIYLAPASKADDALEFGLECLRTQPAEWAEGLPLDSEGAHNRVYLKP